MVRKRGEDGGTRSGKAGHAFGREGGEASWENTTLSL